MNRQPISILSFIRSIVKNRNLIWQMTKREVVGRYKGSFLGIIWSFVNPLIMLSIYTFVFSIVFNARWGLVNESKVDFALILFASLTVYNLFSEAVNKSPMLILQNPSFVKKVVFPLETLPLINVLSSLFHLLISLAVLIIFYMIARHSLQWTVIFFPLIILPHLIFTLAITYFLSSIGVFFRDVAQIITSFTTVLMFLTPIFYPASAVPNDLKIFLYLNPIAGIVEQARGALIMGVIPDVRLVCIYTVVSVLFLWLSFIFFQKTRHAFADVM